MSKLRNEEFQMKVRQDPEMANLKIDTQPPEIQGPYAMMNSDLSQDFSK